MKEIYKNIETFLENPVEHIEKFGNSEALFWVDWREDDEDVVKYVNEILQEDDKFNYKTEIDEDGDVHIILFTKGYGLTNGKSHTIFNPKSRDTTIKDINEFIKPKNEIRWFLESLGDDTLAFVLMSCDNWKKLEQQFGKEKVDYYFMPIHKDSVMFDLDIDKVFDLIKERGKG